MFSFTSVTNSLAEEIHCKCAYYIWMKLITGFAHKSKEEQEEVEQKLLQQRLDMEEKPAQKFATWFTVVDSSILKSLPYPFSENSENYEGADEHKEDQQRILHACSKCIEDLLKVLPEGIEMNEYKDGVRAQVKMRGKDHNLKLYTLCA